MTLDDIRWLRLYVRPFDSLALKKTFKLLDFQIIGLWVYPNGSNFAEEYWKCTKFRSMIPWVRWAKTVYIATVLELMWSQSTVRDGKNVRMLTIGNVCSYFKLKSIGA